MTLTHPLWCDRAGCVDRAEHRSPELTTDIPPAIPVAAYLVELIGAEHLGPLVAVRADIPDPSEPPEILLNLAQAATLSIHLRTLLRATRATS